ncbi:ankyrin repeat and fibronectin type-III domain-containing protein 1-like protein [Leptotrombidium deliense]|uniref:Ankyrin repeat and fibronectin type-III domain-containing protein 1-like protein n=1 Tax=Leptotrombidium deliense TaxID=299467 RepID=A0A443SAY9_9ACAR|nr:ankyrin repeat and fibronectin type-III domain-containing protein 1-like protein [Leptotrombidium deliense]
MIDLVCLINVQLLSESLNIKQRNVNQAKRASSGGPQRTSADSSFKFSIFVDDEENAKGTKSPSLSPRHSVSSTSSTGSTSASGKQKNVGFSKLARLLSQPKEAKISSEKIQSPMASSDSTYDVSCFSWNRGSLSGERTPLKKSGSIDSLLDFQSAENHGINISISEALESPGIEFTANSLSSSFSIKGLSANNELQRCISGNPIPSSPSVHKNHFIGFYVTGKRQGSMDFLFPEGIALNKSERKKLERLNKFNFDVQALFAAVEREQMDRARTLLESTDLDVNSVNSDGFTALDIAVMTLNISMVKLLQKYGAKEGTSCMLKSQK